MASNSESVFKVQQNKSIGRYATATKSLAAGSIVFAEYPFVVGPKTNSRAVCLECCEPIDGTQNGPKCPKCFWPLCQDCKLNSNRKHHLKECALFVENKVKYHDLPTPQQECLQLECITPLR